MENLSLSTTQAALLTPHGRGAVAVLRIAGPRAAQSIATFFEPVARIRVGNFETTRPYFGTWQSAAGASEELIVIRLDDDEFEVHCHGGELAWKRIVDDLATLDVRLSKSNANNQHVSTAIEREAWRELQNAMTSKCAAVLLDQLHGALESCVKKILDSVHAEDLASAHQQTELLLQTSALGAKLTSPWRVIFVGRPNVGKSSLINAILGFERSIVYDRPGTTRDLVTERTALAGWPVELIDSAGIRETSSRVEATGVQKAMGELDNVDLVVRVYEPDQLNDVLDLEMTTGSIDVCNKIDLASCPLETVFLTSNALSGEGVEKIIAAMVATLIPDIPQPGQAVVFHSRQLALLQDCQLALREDRPPDAIEALNRMVTGDAVP